MSIKVIKFLFIDIKKLSYEFVMSNNFCSTIFLKINKKSKKIIIIRNNIIFLFYLNM